MPKRDKDYYSILGVLPEATQEEIKQAYRRLVKEWHPDLNPERRKEAEEHFKEIQEAYAVLSDPQKRHQYDLYGTVGEILIPTTIFDPFSDLFGMMDEFFGGRPKTSYYSPRAERGEDIEFILKLSLEEAFFGGEKELKVSVQDKCGKCAGTGSLGGMSRCSECKGSGKIGHTKRTAGGFIRTVMTCPNCKGYGELPSQICDACEGVGRSQIKRTVKMNLPAGVSDGTVFRFPGQGNAGKAGGTPGDLYVTVQLQLHPIFRLDGNNLHIDLPVSFPQLALGDSVTLQTLDGEVEVTIPPGTQPEEVLKVSRKGFISMNSGRRGDLLVHVKAVIPTELTDEQRKLIKQLAKTMGIEPKGSEASWWEKIKAKFRK